MSATSDILPAGLQQVGTEAVLLVLDALPVSALVIEPERIHLNRAAELLTGYGPGEFSSLGGFLAVTGAAPAAALTEGVTTPATGGIISLSCKDGSRRSLEVVSLASAGEGRLLCTLRETAPETALQLEQKRNQQALAESEERYRCLSDLTSDYVYCCTRTGNGPYRIRWMGGAIEEITGYSESEIYAAGCWMRFAHPDDRERLSASLAALRPGDRATDEIRIVCKNGDICWVRQSARCELGAAAGEVRLFGACQKITESKKAEIALRNVEEVFRQFLEHCPAYLVFKDVNHKVLRLSRNFERLLGRPLHHLIGRTAEELFPPAVAKRITDDDLRVLREGEPTLMEEEINGRQYSSYKFLIPQKNKPALLVAIKTDITERKQAEEALFELNERLDRRVAERTAQLEASILEQESFSYSVSHDLRAPLRHINSFSAILLEDYSERLPEEARDYLSRICAATKRMGVLIDNLLKLSTLGRTVVKRNEVNLSEVAAETALMLQEIEPNRAVRFRIAPEVHAHCDRILIRQLFENLMGNAWKYTGKNADALIEFGVNSTEGRTVFFIKDNGAGFDMLYKDKLFIPFQRLHGPEFEGNGIGLATTQRIIKVHRGQIWAEGSEGEGAQFNFTLA